MVVVLHSAAGSDGGNDAYLVSVNGNRLGDSDQTQGGIPIRIPGVATITLLQVSGGGGTAAAEVGDVSNLLTTSGRQAGVLGTTAQGAPIPTAATAPVTATAPAAPASHPRVPSTGAAIGLAGLALTLGGLALGAGSLLRRRGIR